MTRPLDIQAGAAADSRLNASPDPQLVTLDPVSTLSIAGHGAPGGPAHLQAIRTLFGVVGALRDICADHGSPIAGGPLEGLWWVEDERPALQVPRDEWKWELLVAIPSSMPVPWTSRARSVAAAGDGVQRTTLDEGLCVQALHQGPYEDEPRTLALMDDFMQRNGLTMNGRHHEIYLTGVETPPAAATTILRHPVRPG